MISGWIHTSEAAVGAAVARVALHGAETDRVNRPAHAPARPLAREAVADLKIDKRILRR